MTTDKVWADWGANDPYYGVLTDERFRNKSIDNNRDEFFATGETFVADILATTEHVFGPVARRRALDFGCGVRTTYDAACAPLR